MKGTYFLGAGQIPVFETREMDRKELGPKDVLVKVHACGVCGTDVHICHGEEGSAPVTPPVILGHEVSGIVEQVGANVTLCKAKDHVTLDPNLYCRTCRPCREGKKQNCEHLYGLGVNTDGGFAEYCIVLEEQCFVLDESIDLDEAALTEPLACALHGIDNAHILPGQTVLVIGGGTIGLLMVQLARLSGASKVLLSEPIATRRQIALETGAVDAVINPADEDIVQRIKDICKTDGTDVVIECVGNEKAVSQALAAAGFSGTILLFSVPKPGSSVPLPLMDVFKKELHITGSIINPDTHQRAADLISSGRLQLKKLITHVFDIEHLEDAIKCQMSDSSIKVLVKPC